MSAYFEKNNEKVYLHDLASASGCSESTIKHFKNAQSQGVIEQEALKELRSKNPGLQGFTGCVLRTDEGK